jgi:hypothetical protein
MLMHQWRFAAICQYFELFGPALRLPEIDIEVSTICGPNPDLILVSDLKMKLQE